jgi:hypothetical protein
MKIKGITIWEQHLEKIVLLAAVLVFLGLAAMQFIGQPNAVVKAGRTIAPAEVDELLKESAESVLQRLAQEAAPPVELQSPKSATEYLRSRLSASTGPGRELPPFQLALAPDIGVHIGPTNARFIVPDVAPPARVTARGYHDALVPEVIEQHKDALQPLFPGGQPYDLSYVSVFGRINLAEIRAEFARVPPAESGEKPIPAGWLGSDTARIVDVVWDREELVDGHWTGLTTLEPIPGQMSLRRQVSAVVDATARSQILDKLSRAETQTLVLQPPFYATKNSSWSPPPLDDAAAIRADPPEVADLKRRLRRDQNERAQKVKELEELGGNLNDPDEPVKPPKGPGGGPGGGDGGGAPEEPDGPGGGGSGGDGKGGGGKGGRDAPTGPGGLGDGGFRGRNSGDQDRVAERNKAKVKSLKEQIQRLDRRIERLNADLARLIGPDGANAAQAAAPEQADQALTWAHDISVKPDRTYRYRATLRLYNPFFRKALNLVAEQQPLAEEFTLASKTSEWSEPITVEPMVNIFVTDARAGSSSAPAAGGRISDALGLATVEVYRFFDGRWWSAQFAVAPGDRIGGVEEVKAPRPLPRGDEDGDGVEDVPPTLPTAIDYGTEWFVVDIVAELEGAGASALGGRDAAARVLLQSLNGGGATVLRLPSSDRSDPRRQELEDAVDLAGR